LDVRARDGAGSTWTRYAKGQITCPTDETEQLVLELTESVVDGAPQVPPATLPDYTVAAGPDRLVSARVHDSDQTPTQG
jgi:hypothetical protein